MWVVWCSWDVIDRVAALKKFLDSEADKEKKEKEATDETSKEFSF